MRTTDICVIQKQTALERYTKRPIGVDFLEYLERDGQNLEALIKAHESHCNAREALLELLSRLGLSYDLYNLDEISQSSFAFAQDTGDASGGPSGIATKTGLVISLGGDGTLLCASHFVGQETRLLGVNSCPDHSVGHLCAATQATMERTLSAVLDGTAPVADVRRLKVDCSNGQVFPLGLNDVLLCNKHPAATSRYLLSLHEDGSVASEKHLSSGVWISTGAGSTAAISSYGLPRLPLDSPHFLFAVREPYRSERGLAAESASSEAHGYGLQSAQIAAPEPSLRKKMLDGDRERITLFSRMRQGLVCVDGSEFSTLIGFGESVEVSLPRNAVLRLVVSLETS